RPAAAATAVQGDRPGDHELPEREAADDLAPAARAAVRAAVRGNSDPAGSAPCGAVVLKTGFAKGTKMRGFAPTGPARSDSVRRARTLPFRSVRKSLSGNRHRVRYVVHLAMKV